MLQELNKTQKNILWKKVIFKFNIFKNRNDIRLFRGPDPCCFIMTDIIGNVAGTG
jgi:hypothetical protein